jgi:hypothetical protein
MKPPATESIQALRTSGILGAVNRPQRVLGLVRLRRRPDHHFHAATARRALISTPARRRRTSSSWLPREDARRRALGQPWRGSHTSRQKDDQGTCSWPRKIRPTKGLRRQRSKSTGLVLRPRKKDRPACAAPCEVLPGGQQFQLIRQQRIKDRLVPLARAWSL